MALLDVDRLAGDARLGAVDEHQDLRRLARFQPPRVVLGNLDADAGLAGDDQSGSTSSSRKTWRDDPEVLRVLELLEQLPALLRAGLIEDDRADVADVGVDGVAEHEQLERPG